MDGNADDNDEWGEAAADAGEVDNFAEDVFELRLRDDKGYKPVKSEMVSQQVVTRIKELEELYSLDLNPLIIIAQHYKWNPDKMQEWLLRDD